LKEIYLLKNRRYCIQCL